MSVSQRMLAVVVLPALLIGTSSSARSQDEVLGKSRSQWLDVLEKDEKPQLRKAAVIALGIFGAGQKDVLPALSKALASDKDDGVRLQVVTILGSVRKDSLRDALPTLADVVKGDKSAAVRAEGAASLMANLGELAKPALATLVGALKDADAGVRAAAVETIGKIGPEAKSAINDMLPLLKDSEPLVRFTTVFAYSRLGTDASFVIPDLLQVLEKDESSDVRREVARALTVMGGSTVKLVLPAVVKGLQNDKSDEVRRQLAVTLGKMGDIKPAMKEVLEVLKLDTDRTVRLYLVRSIPAALSGGGLKDYVKDYAEWLNRESDGDVRLAIVQELGALGPAAKEALDALSNAQSDVVLQVREAARLAIMQVKGMVKKDEKK